MKFLEFCTIILWLNFLFHLMYVIRIFYVSLPPIWKSQNTFFVSNKNCAKWRSFWYIKIAICYYSWDPFSTFDPLIGLITSRISLVKRRVCGVERLVRSNRRGNLGFRQVVSTLFFLPKMNMADYIYLAKNEARSNEPFIPKGERR